MIKWCFNRVAKEIQIERDIEIQLTSSLSLVKWNCVLALSFPPKIISVFGKSYGKKRPEVNPSGNLSIPSDSITAHCYETGGFPVTASMFQR